jgi:hypothetical protein
LNREFNTRTKLLYALFKNKVLGYDELQRVVNDYAKNPQIILKKYGVV